MVQRGRAEESEVPLEYLKQVSAHLYYFNMQKVL